METITKPSVGTADRKERHMASTSSVTVAPIAFTAPGALSGFEARCTCGTALTTSLGHREALKLAHEHAAWHAQR
jgi:hypothetical protein